MADLNVEVLVPDLPEALPVLGLPRQSSVELSVAGADVSLLTAFIDRTASQSTIIRDLQSKLTDFAVPYRRLDRRILEAIRIKLNENLTYDEASIRVFGNPNFSRKLRYWRNRWGMQ